jgi:hypothetical protein
MVSDKGRVWSEKTKRFLKIKPMDDHGHLGVCLYKDGTRRYAYIHRLVAKAFIPNPDNLPIVWHLYDDPSQNAVEDLVWGTQRDNLLDAAINGTAYVFTDEDRMRSYSISSIPVVATEVSSGRRKYFRSQGEAAKELRIPQSNIWKALNHQRHTAGGYIFEED